MRFPVLPAVCSACLCCSAACLTDVSVRVVSPWTNLVEIAYSLGADLAPAKPNGRLVQTVTVHDKAKGTSLVLTNNLAETSLFPRTPTFQAGLHRLVWTPADPSRVPARATVEIAVHETTTPQRYCVVDLSGGASATNHPVSYLDDVPAGGWTDMFKTDYLVLRLIEPGAFAMGDLVHGGPAYPDITLTRAYYMGVFETTEGQLNRMGGKTAADSTLPATGVAFTNLRGSTNGAKWPQSADIDKWPVVVLNGLRLRSGLAFDLPTEAQWEHACRAGTTTDYGNGTDWADSAHDEASMAAVGRYGYNRPQGGTTAPVGSYAPNAWGLYDMHGNVQEWCLDWYGPSLTAGATDPVGPSDAAGSGLGKVRVVRGGYWGSSAANCTSGARSCEEQSTGNDRTGFRLVFPAPMASDEVRESGRSPETALAYDARDPLPVGGDPLPIDFDPLYAGVDPSAGAYTVRVTLDGAETLVETNGFGRLEGWTAHWHTNTLRLAVLRDGAEVGTPLERTLVSTLGPDSLTLAECVNAPALEFTAGGTGGWSRDTVTNMDGVVSLRSRDTGNNGCTWLETTVVGEGTLSFWWKVSSEMFKTYRIDYVNFLVDGSEKAWITGDKDWQCFSVEVEGEGLHVLRWAYQKDDQAAEGEDCAWLDRVSWSGAVPGPPRDETETTPVPVPYAWLDRQPSVLAAAGGDYEAAANAPTGKRDAAGNPMYVWQDFVAGTDPADPDDVLRARIEMVDGRPVVTWTPDLGEARRYRLQGAVAPTGPWTELGGNEPGPAVRFFKVSVSLPE